MTDTPYVFVIHGTWNPPGSPARWHQLDDNDPANFCKLLNDRLEKRGMGRPVWRPWGDKLPFEGWTGANQHADRIEAGDLLYQRWQDLLTQDPTARIHIVAHSHGCNVTLHAVERYLAFLYQQAKDIADLAEKFALAGSPDRAVVLALSKKFGPDASDIWAQRNSVLRVLYEDPAGQGPLPSWDGLNAPGGPYADYLERGDRMSLMRGHWVIVSDVAHRVARGLRAGFEELKRRHSKGRTNIFPFGAGSGRAWNAMAIRAAQAAYPEWVAWHWTLERVRSRHERFIDAWVAAEATNRLGFLCLMGAPYYSKMWPRRSPFRRMGDLGLKAAGRFLDTIASFYLIVLAIWALLWAVVSALKWLMGYPAFQYPLLNPLDWPVLLMLLTGFWIFSATFNAFIDLNPTISDFNPYFREGEVRAPTMLPETSKLPLRTLVINAGILDEVFLGFSAEPLVYGGLQPQIHMLFADSRSGVDVEREPGQQPGPARLLIRLALGWGRQMISRTFRPLIVWLWERYLTVKFVQVLSAFALGMPTRQFAPGLLIVNHRINLPRFFDEYLWNVTEILITQSPIKPLSVEGRKERFAFLWDKRELERLKRQSMLWPRFDLADRSLARRYRPFPQVRETELMERLAQTTIMLEQRMVELVGSVDLVHSAYYTNDVIVDAIAEFLASGRTPPDARAARP
jgi:hypothetical protein